MNDRVVASRRSGGVQLELTALAWRRSYVSAETRKAQIAAYHAKQAKPRGLRRLFSR
jgi:hypothetical protein